MSHDFSHPFGRKLMNNCSSSHPEELDAMDEHEDGAPAMTPNGVPLIPQTTVGINGKY